MPLRARDIADICDELAIERASVTVKEGWDHNPIFFLSFGPLGYKQTIVIEPNWDADDVKAKLEAATVPVPDFKTKEYKVKSPEVETPKPAPKTAKSRKK